MAYPVHGDGAANLPEISRNDRRGVMDVRYFRLAEQQTRTEISQAGRVAWDFGFGIKISLPFVFAWHAAHVQGINLNAAMIMPV